MSADEPRRAGARSSWRRLGPWLGLGLALLALLTVVGVPIPLAPLRGTIERRASETLGLEVRLDALRLVLGVHPGLEIGGLRVAHRIAGRPDVLRAERIALEVSLPALVRRRVHVREASASGVAVFLDAEALPESGAESEGQGAGAGASVASLSAWSVDVERLSLEDVAAELRRPEAEPSRIRLETLTGRLLWDESLELVLAGSYRDLPLAARVEGASLARLLAGARGWPVRAVVDLAGEAVEFDARLATEGGVYRIEDIRGQLGPTPIRGWLALEDLASRPRVSGSIRLGDVDLVLPEPGELEVPEPVEPPPGPLSDLLAGRQAPEGPGPIALMLPLLGDFETDLELEVASISGLGPPIEDLSLALRVSGGALRFPVSLTAAEIPLSGTLRIDEVDGDPRLFFRLGAEDFDVDALGRWLAPEAAIEGTFEKLSLELEGHGDSLLAFLTSLRVDLRAADAALRYGAERTVPFGVEHLELVLEERGALELEARGHLLDQAVGLELSGGSMQSLLGEEPWALRLAARGAGASLDLSGEAIGFLADARLQGDLWIRGGRLSELEPWIGTLPIPDAAYSIRARLDDLPERSTVTLEEVRLGDTTVVGELGEDRSLASPLAWARLRIASLDVSPYVEAARREPSAPREEPGEEFGLDVPILPGGLEIRDLDLALGVQRLVAGDLELADLRFTGAFRDGFLPDSVFGFGLGGASFEGAVAVDLRESPHEATFRFGSGGVDVGRLLSELGLAEGIDARAGSLRVEADGEGATPAELIQQLDVRARLEDVRWTLRDAYSGSEHPLILERGELTSPSGDEPTRLIARGSFRGIPARLSMETEQLSFFQQPRERVPLTLRLEMAGATLEVASEVLLPIERRELALRVSLAGDSLAGASGLLDYELPPIGPYRFTTDLQLTPENYRLSNMRLRVGESRLGGRGRLDTRGGRPRFDVALASDRVQLDDFAEAFGSTEATDRPALPEGVSDEALRDFWSAEGLGGLDGRLEVRVAEVVSGRDELGRGELLATLEKGRLQIDPLHIELPGGPFDLRVAWAYEGHDAVARIRAHTEQFDVGVLARRVDPETDMAGWVSLELDVEGRAPELDRLLANASGHIDFLAAPEALETDVFDLWAVSLLRFLVPRLDPGPRSVLNCAVLRFDLDGGVMEERALLLDTTGMVVQGDATVDFRDERVRAVLTPIPKRPELLSLQTTVVVDGSFDDFDVGVRPEELLATVIRFVTSPVLVPLQYLLGDTLPADGEETCLAAWLEGRE